MLKSISNEKELLVNFMFLSLLIHIFLLLAAQVKCSYRVRAIVGGLLRVGLIPEQGASLQRMADPPQPQTAFTEERWSQSKAAWKHRVQKGGEIRRYSREEMGH